MAAFEDLNVAGFLKQGILSFIPVAQFAVPAALAVTALKKALGIKGAPPPVAGFLLLDAIGVPSEAAAALAPPEGHGLQLKLLNAELAQLDVGRAIWMAHGLQPDLDEILGNPILALAAGGLAGLKQSPAVQAAKAEWEPFQATFLEMNLAFRDHGVERLIEVLSVPVHKTRWLKAQLMHRQFHGLSVKPIKKLLKAAEEAALAAAQLVELAPASPASFEDDAVAASSQVVSVGSSSSGQSPLAQAGEALLGFVGGLVNTLNPKSTSASGASQGSTPDELGTAATSVGGMSPALVVALLVLLVLLALLLAA